MESSSSKTVSPQVRVTEFDILKASHKFLREDNDQDLTWDDQVARKYYSSLYREFAVCDLKHYKSGNFALRWRTEEEVLSGAGESSCGNTRCTFHDVSQPMPSLSTLELPFVYEERGETKSALVKVVLCDKCVKKLMWKRQKEKEKGTPSPDSGDRSKDAGGERTSRKRRRVEEDKIEEDRIRWEGKATKLNGLAPRSRTRSPRPPGKAQFERRKPS